MFWAKCEEKCKEQNITMRSLANELGISPATVTKWKNGSLPNAELAGKLATRLDVSIDYLLSEDEISIEPNKKTSSFQTLKAIPQRWLSLRSGKRIPNEQIIAISNYLNCTLGFLFNEEEMYQPSQEKYPLNNLTDINTLLNILSIMDKCADSEEYRTFQVQISKVIIYHIKNAGVTEEMLSNSHKIEPKKLNYLISGKKNKESVCNYGLNFTDITLIAETFSEIPNIQYMFTGQKENITDTMKKIITDSGISF